MADPIALAWSLPRLGEAIYALAHAARLAPRLAQVSVPPVDLEQSGPALDRWIDGAAAALGLESEPVESTYAEVESFLLKSGPSLVRISADGDARFLALLGRRGERLLVLPPDDEVVAVPLQEVRQSLCRTLEAPAATALDSVLSKAGVAEGRRSVVRDAILRDRLGAARIGGGWLLRLPPGASFGRQVRLAGIGKRLGILVGAHVAQYVLYLLAWGMIGRGALEGRTEPGWLAAWGLILITMIPIRMLFTWTQGTLTIGLSGLLKRRILQGALRLDPEEIRHQGAGGLFGRVLEAEALEALALSGGLIAVLSLIEIVFAATVLWAGVGGTLHAGALLLWAGIAVAIAWSYGRRRTEWTSARITMTHDLVERMTGHRTRLVQESARHNDEDLELERYQGRSRAMDRAEIWLSALIPRGWMLLGVAALGVAFVSGKATPGGLAVSLGGVILAYQALHRLTMGLSQLIGAGIAWKQVGPLFRAAARTEPTGSPVFAARTTPSAPGAVVEAGDLVFRYTDRAEPVLRGCSLRVGSGERILLEGASGSGKTTLISILAGLRTASSGLLLLRGLDRHALGADGWRRRAVLAPQFHENHVLTETLAFNLLMGRRWPPEPEDMNEAETVCRELGLGPLLQRMPAGLLQTVGETGWRLSHGERSRVFIARALLQGGEVIFLDESFGALDPESLRQAVRCVHQRAPALVVIAHP